jgi:two-component system response regulator VanR
MKKHILVVEDEEEIRDILLEFLTAAGYEVLTADNGLEGVELFHRHKFHLLLIDVMMPKIDGFTMVEIVRKESEIPIILLTALAGEEEQVRGFDLRVDDYVTKPFSMRILLKRIENVLRKANAEEDNFLHHGRITVDLKCMQVSVLGDTVALTNKEYEMLVYFIRHKGEVVTRQQLLNQIWKYDYYGDERIVDTHIKNLRKKLMTDSIVTIRGRGYRLDDADQ